MTEQEKRKWICENKDTVIEIASFILNSIPVKLPLYKWVIVPVIMSAITKFIEYNCREQKKSQ